MSRCSRSGSPATISRRGMPDVLVLTAERSRRSGSSRANSARLAAMSSVMASQIQSCAGADQRFQLIGFCGVLRCGDGAAQRLFSRGRVDIIQQQNPAADRGASRRDAAPIVPPPITATELICINIHSLRIAQIAPVIIATQHFWRDKWPRR